MPIRCSTGNKIKMTPPNEIAQLTDHAISRTNNVLRLRFVISAKFRRRSLHANQQGKKKADEVRDWKNVNSSQRRARITVTDHSSRVQTGTPFLAFKPSAKSDRKDPLSNEPQKKIK
jgi:antirestriction protein ArdC